MATIAQLKRENEKLRNIQQGINDIKKIQAERMKIQKENKALSRNIRYGRSMQFGKGIGRAIEKGTMKVGEKGYKLGASIAKSITAYGRKLNEAEAREKAYKNRRKKSYKPVTRKKK